MEEQVIEAMDRTSEPPQSQAEAQAPVPDAPEMDAPDGELEPVVATLMLMTGARILQHIADNDRDGAVAFVDEVFREVRRQQRLQQLLEMDQQDLDRLLQGLEQAAQPEGQPSAGAANSPARELFSPAERTGKAKPSEKQSLREYVFGG